MVWGDRKGYVFVPRWLITGKNAKGKPEGDWEDGRAFKWPEEKEAIWARVTKSADAGYEVYFCPIVFDGPRRHKTTAPKTLGWLWADDVPAPDTISPRPTIAWASSDNSRQALWCLDEESPTEQAEAANKALAYSLGADRSGWDVTQVLRVPGLLNRKYSPAQEGRLLWKDGPAADLKAVLTLHPLVSEAKVEVPLTADADERLDEIRRILLTQKVSPRAKELLLVHPEAVEKGTRSERLWELETTLVEDGCPIHLAARLVALSAWNKFRDRHDGGESQIIREMLKAEEKVKATKPTLPIHKAGSGDGVTLVTEADKPAADWLTPYDKFLSKAIKPPQWLVEGIWQEGYGMVAGEPKTYKSVTTMDLAVSVASGTPFLGVFPVRVRGPVLMIQEENGENTVQDRLFKVAMQKHLLEAADEYLPDDIEIYFSNNAGMDLTDMDCQNTIEAAVAKYRPLLMVLDPLYMMMGDTDENSAPEVNRVLRWLTKLRNVYGVFTVLVHHYKKAQNSTRGGQNIRGSSAFHGWIETGLYLSLAGAPGEVTLGREFRSMAPQRDLSLRYNIDIEYDPEVLDDGGSGSLGLAAKKEEVLAVLASKPMTKDDLRAAVRVDRAKLTVWLKEYELEGVIRWRKSNGQRVYELAEKKEEGA
jgi:hypothetical protein